MRVPCHDFVVGCDRLVPDCELVLPFLELLEAQEAVEAIKGERLKLLFAFRFLHLNLMRRPASPLHR